MCDWSRPFWKPTGRPASLFYFIPGEPPQGGLQLSRSRHHVEGFPDGLDVSSHKRSDAPDWFAGFFARPGLGFELDEVFGDQASKVRGAETGMVVRGEFPDPPDLDYLRDSVGVISALLDQGGLGVLDMFACRWWSAEEWAARFVDRSGFVLKDFIQIITSDDEQLHPGIWVHTRGMRKFSRPELQIKHIPGPWLGENPLIKAAGVVLNALAERLCLGAVIDDGDTMTLRGMSRQCTFLLTPDDIDSPACHFGNEVLEVVDLDKGEAADNLNKLLAEGADG
jgi:hypothetical protein